MTLKEQAESLGIKVDGRWSDERIQEEIARVEPKTEKVDQAKVMNDLAKRIWDGQSVSLSPGIRVKRIKERLVNKGYGEMLDNLELPVEKKYL